MRQISFLFFITLIFLLSLPNDSKAAQVFWDGIELKKGQIGRITVSKPINLWKRTPDGLQFERILKPGERYRVYSKDSEYGGQYGLGSDYYITNIPSRVIYETPSISKIKLLDCNKECLVALIVHLPEESFDKKEASTIQNRLLQLPEKILVDLITHDIQVVLTTGLITDIPDFTYLKNVTPRGWEGTNLTWDDVPGIGGTHSVVIRIGHSEKGKGHNSVNLELHELAHSIDQIIKNFLSNTNEFHRVWKNESKILFPKQEYYQNQDEYFAETFAMYFLSEQHRVYLKSKAPQTYEFLKSIKW